MTHISTTVTTNHPYLDTILGLRLFRLTTTMVRMTTAQTVSDALAEVLRAEAQRVGVSQRDLAEATGIPLVTLNRALTKRRHMTSIELIRLCDALGVTLTDVALKAERLANDGGAAA